MHLKRKNRQIQKRKRHVPGREKERTENSRGGVEQAHSIFYILQQYSSLIK